jgi:hypothetical protein
MALLGSIAIAQSQRSDGHGKPGDVPLPAGWTEADMQACMKAGKPGPMHELLARSAGVWRTESTMWMGPDTAPMTGAGKATVTPIMDGRYIRVEMTGETPCMGPYNGSGVYGDDNVAEEFQCSWIDNCSTGIMNGTGQLSSDGRTISWTFDYNCPITKKPAVLREVERLEGEDSKTLTIYGREPRNNHGFKMMEIVFTRDGIAQRAGGGR